MNSATWRHRAAFFTVLYAALSPVALIALAHRLWRRRKGLIGWREKFHGEGAAITPGQILVHGVSLGEVMLMRSLVPDLEKATGKRCLLSTTTETGRAALDQHFADHERALLPFDVPWAVGRFLSRAKPSAVVLLELEVWPLLLCACHARGIPVMLVNARVSERSFKGYRRAGAAMRPLFRALTLAIGQNVLWTSRLVQLGVASERAIVGGSMKADMVRRANDEQTAAEAQRLGLRAQQKILLIASTSAGEERTLLAGHAKEWLERGWQIVICPRHPERGEEIAALIGECGLQARRSNKGERLADGNDIAIVDEIGKLGALYAWTARSNGIAVVGGSLGSGRGGQNMLEAAAAGCCTVVGPDTRNFPDAMALLRDADGVVEATIETIHAELGKLAENPELRRRLGERGNSAWRQGQGATHRVVAALADSLRRFT